MVLRGMIAASLSLVVAGAVVLYLATSVFAASALPHGGYGAAGQPYYGSQVVDNNYTYYVYERDQGMNSWQFATGRRYINGFYSGGPPMRQYVVYSGSQQDTDLATWYRTPSCAGWDALGYSAYRTFEFAHNGLESPLNNDSTYTVVCVNMVSLGYPVGLDQLDQATRVRAMTHEMGHSLHLDHDTNGAMCKCFSYDIQIQEVILVNSIYSSPP